MIVMLAVDNRNGMLFHHRRQSQDRVLREKVLESAGGKRLWMNAYSAGQFSAEAEITVDEAFLEKAKKGEYCFVEDRHLLPYQQRIESLVLFHWNRDYPGDFYFDLDLADGNWRRIETEEFAGFSHEEITKEVYLHV